MLRDYCKVFRYAICHAQKRLSVMFLPSILSPIYKQINSMRLNVRSTNNKLIIDLGGGGICVFPFVIYMKYF